jgi:hypothetical protein
LAQIPHADPGLICPLHKKDVSKVCHRCPWWISVRGTNKNTGEDIDNWGCAIGYLPLLLIENAQMQNRTGAAVESFRNDLVSGVVEAVGVAADAASRLIEFGKR